MSKHLLSLREAAESVGKSKATIHRACKKGKVSYGVDEEGRFKIQPQEMARAYPEDFNSDLLPQRMRDWADPPSSPQNPMVERSETCWFEREIEYLKETIALLNGERAQERLRMAEEIEHLRGRLEAADVQRLQLTLLLESERPPPEAPFSKFFSRWAS